MKRLLFLIATATSLTTPALAQHGGHHMPGHAMPMPKAAPKKPAAKPASRKAAPKAKPAAKPAAKAKPAAQKAAAKQASKPVRRPAPKRPAANPQAGHAMPAAPGKPKAVDPHAGHNMTPPPASQPDPHAGHIMPPPPAADPHAGHGMGPAPAARADPHAGHQMGNAAEAPSPPLAPPPPDAFSGPAHAADTVFGEARMAPSREHMRHEHGDMTTSKILVDQLEARFRGGRDGYRWDAQGWYGGDIDQFWLKTEGEGVFGERVEEAEVQALWSHAIDPWFDLQAGVRYDLKPNPERAHLVLGVQGLAPYWFEIDAAAFVSTKGDVSARIEAEYDLRLTGKLILQPRAELDLSLQDVPELGIGSGLSAGEIGARLRYEIRPEFVPYVGLEYERAFSNTADFRRAAGEKAGDWSFLIGLRTWF